MVSVIGGMLLGFVLGFVAVALILMWATQLPEQPALKLKTGKYTLRFLDRNGKVALNLFK